MILHLSLNFLNGIHNQSENTESKREFGPFVLCIFFRPLFRCGVGSVSVAADFDVHHIRKVEVVRQIFQNQIFRTAAIRMVCGFLN